MDEKTGTIIVVELGNGSIFRLLTLMTHYRSPLDFSAARMAEARRVLVRWGRAAIPCEDGPPIEVLEALCEDMNTPKAIAAMHVYRKTDGRKLYAAMRFLGLFDGVCTPDEIKTVPLDHLGKAQPGPQTMGIQ